MTSPIAKSCKKAFGTTSLYKIFEIPNGTILTPETLHKFWIKQCLKWHSDKHVDAKAKKKEDARIKFALIEEIYIELKKKHFPNLSDKNEDDNNEEGAPGGGDDIMHDNFEVWKKENEYEMELLKKETFNLKEKLEASRETAYEFEDKIKDLEEEIKESNHQHEEEIKSLKANVTELMAAQNESFKDYFVQNKKTIEELKNSNNKILMENNHKNEEEMKLLKVKVEASEAKNAGFEARIEKLEKMIDILQTSIKTLTENKTQREEESKLLNTKIENLEAENATLKHDFQEEKENTRIHFEKMEKTIETLETSNNNNFMKKSHQQIEEMKALKSKMEIFEVENATLKRDFQKEKDNSKFSFKKFEQEMTEMRSMIFEINQKENSLSLSATYDSENLFDKNEFLENQNSLIFKPKSNNENINNPLNKNVEVEETIHIFENFDVHNPATPHTSSNQNESIVHRLRKRKHPSPKQQLKNIPVKKKSRWGPQENNNNKITTLNNVEKNNNRDRILKIQKSNIPNNPKIASSKEKCRIYWNGTRRAASQNPKQRRRRVLKKQQSHPPLFSIQASSQNPIITTPRNIPLPQQQHRSPCTASTSESLYIFSLNNNSSTAAKFQLNEKAFFFR